MIVAGYEYRNELPFENVYFTGIVRDKQGRKMSKSLGNSPDPIELMNEYGADATRMGMLLTAPAGNDLPFDVDLCLQGRNFANKIWNAFRLIKGWEIDENLQPSTTQTKAVEWFENKFNAQLADIEANYEKYRLSDSLMGIYKLVWDDFCSWYLEAIKPTFGEQIDRQTFDATIGYLENVLKVLHPFMPFLTEEIWHLIAERTEKDALIIAEYPEVKAFDEVLIQHFENTKEATTAIRGLRSEKGMSPKEALEVFADANASNEIFVDVFSKLGNVSNFNIGAKPEKGFAFRVGTLEFMIPMSDNIDVEAEREKLQKEIEYNQGFLNSVRKKLSNEKFVAGAPEQVIANERKKEADALAKIAQIEEQLAAL